MKIRRPTALVFLLLTVFLLVGGYFALRVSPPLEEEGTHVEVPKIWVETNGNALGNLMTATGIIPFMRGEQFIGFQISHLETPSPVDVLQLKKDDVLLELAGVRLDGPATGLDAFHAVRQATGPVVLVVERAGQRVRYIYSVR